MNFIRKILNQAITFVVLFSLGYMITLASKSWPVDGLEILPLEVNKYCNEAPRGLPLAYSVEIRDEEMPRPAGCAVPVFGIDYATSESQDLDSKSKLLFYLDSIIWTTILYLVWYLIRKSSIEIIRFKKK